MALGSAARSYPSTKQAPEAKTGGKGIRTPGLLIANETLYQLSYTPEIRLSAATVTAARDFSNEEVYQGIVVDIDFKNT